MWYSKAVIHLYSKYIWIVEPYTVNDSYIFSYRFLKYVIYVLNRLWQLDFILCCIAAYIFFLETLFRLLTDIWRDILFWDCPRHFLFCLIHWSFVIHYWGKREDNWLIAISGKKKNGNPPWILGCYVYLKKKSWRLQISIKNNKKMVYKYINFTQCKYNYWVSGD